MQCCVIINRPYRELNQASWKLIKRQDSPYMFQTHHKLIMVHIDGHVFLVILTVSSRQEQELVPDISQLAEGYRLCLLVQQE